MDGRRTTILGVAIDAIEYDGVLAWVDAAVRSRQFGYVVTANVDHVMKLRSDEAFRQAYDGASLVVADGVPLLWAAALRGERLPGRVNGTELFERLAGHAAIKRYGLFLLGGTADAAARAAQRLVARHPLLRIAGTYAPPFGFEHDAASNAAIAAMIRASGAHILVAGLGAPKQEKWIAEHGPSTGVSFAVGVGISFSLVAGLVPRAPKWMQLHGLEWLWRLCAEPRRLWKRYLIDDLPFFFLVAHEMFARRSRQRHAGGDLRSGPGGASGPVRSAPEPAQAGARER